MFTFIILMFPATYFTDQNTSDVGDSASTQGEYGLNVVAEGAPNKQANPFDYGGGHVNPNRAMDPGLIYDMELSEYTHFLCSMGYNNSAISYVTQHHTVCHHPVKPQKDLNLPAISIPELKGTLTVSRTVTNVGPVASTYTAKLEPPPGVSVNVKPSILAFNSTIKKLKFKVTLKSRLKAQSGYLFGSLSWEDGIHSVRIPVAVRTVSTDFSLYS